MATKSTPPTYFSPSKTNPTIHPTIILSLRPSGNIHQQQSSEFLSIHLQISNLFRNRNHQHSEVIAFSFITAMPRGGLSRIDWGKQENTERLLAAILAAQGLKVSLCIGFAPFLIIVLDVCVPISLAWITDQLEEKRCFSFLLFPLRL